MFYKGLDLDILVNRMSQVFVDNAPPPLQSEAPSKWIQNKGTDR